MPGRAKRGGGYAKVEAAEGSDDELLDDELEDQEEVREPPTPPL